MFLAWTFAFSLLPKDTSPGRNTSPRFTLSMTVIQLIKISVIWDVTLCRSEESAASVFRVQEPSALIMEKAGFSETLMPVLPN
jgi:hypothetical protein